MADEDKNRLYCQWRTGVWRVMNASWAAAWLSYGLNAEQITALAEYYSLVANCLANIALAQGEIVILDDNLQI